MSVHDEVQMQVTKTVQNIPPFAWTQARSLERHWSITYVDDASLQPVPHVNQTLLHIINVSHLRPINTVLHRTPHLVINRADVGVVGRSQAGSN